ncbi:PD-(D/E)XK nuclease family protein [Rhodococcus sp. NPDC056743]|uniref:PD-(D/E)XK nuclease family protein n=1 Tax=Rhodococcus sp. NPDC056743 TaxID=3345934 RepID=UPI003671B30B
MATYPSLFLQRLFRSEVNVGAFIGYLVERDATPLQNALGLDESVVSARVEVPHGKGRMDVVLYGATSPIAILELKISATEHGDQLDRYAEFAHTHDARKFLVDLEFGGSTVPEGWTHIELANLFGYWSSSTNSTVRGLAAEASSVFAAWKSQLNSRFGQMDSAILTVALRAVSHELAARTPYAMYTRATSGGQPSITAYLPHPSGTDDAYFCIDIRCNDKSNPHLPWIARLGVHVDCGEDLAAARRTAHLLAMPLVPALTVAKVQSACANSGTGTLATILSADKPLKEPRARETSIEKWLAAVDIAGDGKISAHPVFFHDWGRRLAAKFSLDLTDMTRNELEQLIVILMDHLTEYSEPHG